MMKNLILVAALIAVTSSALSFQTAAEDAAGKNLTEEVQYRAEDSSLGGEPENYDLEDLNIEDSAETDENITREVAREVNETMEEIRKEERKNKGKGLFSAIFQFF